MVPLGLGKRDLPWGGETMNASKNGQQDEHGGSIIGDLAEGVGFSSSRAIEYAMKIVNAAYKVGITGTDDCLRMARQQLGSTQFKAWLKGIGGVEQARSFINQYSPSGLNSEDEELSIKELDAYIEKVQRYLPGKQNEAYRAELIRRQFNEIANRGDDDPTPYDPTQDRLEQHAEELNDLLHGDEHRPVSIEHLRKANAIEGKPPLPKEGLDSGLKLVMIRTMVFNGLQLAKHRITRLSLGGLALMVFCLFATLYILLITPGPWVYHKQDHDNLRTNRWTSKVQYLDPTLGWVPLEAVAQDQSITASTAPPTASPLTPQFEAVVGNPGATTFYTYHDQNGRLIINNMPPSDMQDHGVVLKHVGIGSRLVTTEPYVMSTSGKPK